MLTRHESYHQGLNDVTLFGFALKIIADKARDVESSDRYKRILKSLISRCRKTHEIFATYGCCVDTSGKPRIDFGDNYEYQQYFYLAQSFASRLTSVALGICAVSGVVRLAMNCPLPESFLSGSLDQFQPGDFRGIDSPDVRLEKFFQLFDAPFWRSTCHEAAKLFGNHPDWKVFYDRNTKKILFTGQYLKLYDLGGGIFHARPGGPDDNFETLITNFLIDRMCIFAMQKEIPVFSLKERIELEMQLDTLYGSKNDRPYTTDAAVTNWKIKRLCEQETLHYRDKPLQARIEKLDFLKFCNEWRDYQKIIASEGYLPVYCRMREEVLINHDIPTSVHLTDDPIMFYLRRKIYLENEEVGLQIHTFDKPMDLERLIAMTFMSGKQVRLIISGQAIISGGKEMFQEWGNAFASLFFCVLLDTDIANILPFLNTEWEALAQYQTSYEGISILLIYPIGKKPLPDVGFIRPGTSYSLDAIISSFDEPLINASIIRLGTNTVGLSKEARAIAMSRCDKLEWGAVRLISEEFKFEPLIVGEDDEK